MDHFYRKANFIFRIACLLFLQNLLPVKGNSQTPSGWYCNLCGAGPFSGYIEGRHHIYSKHYFKGAVVISSQNEEVARRIRKKIEEKMGKLISEPKKPVLLLNVPIRTICSPGVKKALNCLKISGPWEGSDEASLDEVTLGGKG